MGFTSQKGVGMLQSQSCRQYHHTAARPFSKHNKYSEHPQKAMKASVVLICQHSLAGLPELATPAPSSLPTVLSFNSYHTHSTSLPKGSIIYYISRALDLPMWTLTKKVKQITLKKEERNPHKPSVINLTFSLFSEACGGGCEALILWILTTSSSQVIHGICCCWSVALGGLMLQVFGSRSKEHSTGASWRRSSIALPQRQLQKGGKRRRKKAHSPSARRGAHSYAALMTMALWDAGRSWKPRVVKLASECPAAQWRTHGGDGWW